MITLPSLLLLGCSPQEPSAGIYVTLLRRGPDAAPQSTDGVGLRTLTIESKDIVRLRGEHIRLGNPGNRLEEVFRTRAERLLLVKVEGPVMFADVIDVLQRASSHVPLQFALITARSTPTPAEPSLFMRGEAIYTQYVF